MNRFDGGFRAALIGKKQMVMGGSLRWDHEGIRLSGPVRSKWASAMGIIGLLASTPLVLLWFGVVNSEERSAVQEKYLTAVGFLPTIGLWMGGVWVGKRLFRPKVVEVHVPWSRVCDVYATNETLSFVAKPRFFALSQNAGEVVFKPFLRDLLHVKRIDATERRREDARLLLHGVSCRAYNSQSGRFKRGRRPSATRISTTGFLPRIAPVP